MPADYHNNERKRLCKILRKEKERRKLETKRESERENSFNIWTARGEKIKHTTPKGQKHSVGGNRGTH